MPRSLGVDFGLKRIGLALSDEGKRIAAPLPNLLAERTLEKTVDKLLLLIDERAVDEVVVGLPYRLSGERGEMADQVLRFVDLLKSRFSGSVVLVDERLVSVQADRVMKEGNLRRKKRSQLVDGLSAVIILQTHLSRNRPIDDPHP